MKDLFKEYNKNKKYADIIEENRKQYENIKKKYSASINKFCEYIQQIFHEKLSEELLEHKESFYELVFSLEKNTVDLYYEIPWYEDLDYQYYYEKRFKSSMEDFIEILNEENVITACKRIKKLSKTKKSSRFLCYA